MILEKIYEEVSNVLTESKFEKCNSWALCSYLCTRLLPVTSMCDQGPLWCGRDPGAAWLGSAQQSTGISYPDRLVRADSSGGGPCPGARWYTLQLPVYMVVSRDSLGWQWPLPFELRRSRDPSVWLESDRLFSSHPGSSPGCIPRYARSRAQSGGLWPGRKAPTGAESKSVTGTAESRG